MSGLLTTRHERQHVGGRVTTLGVSDCVAGSLLCRSCARSGSAIPRMATSKRCRMARVTGVRSRSGIACRASAEYRAAALPISGIWLMHTVTGRRESATRAAPQRRPSRLRVAPWRRAARERRSCGARGMSERPASGAFVSQWRCLPGLVCPCGLSCAQCGTSWSWAVLGGGCASHRGTHDRCTARLAARLSKLGHGRPPFVAFFTTVCRFGALAL